MVGSYPVTYEIERPRAYNRLTVAFRLILAIPQLFLVGGVGYQFAAFSRRGGDSNEWFYVLPSSGILTWVLGIVVFLAWFAIMFTGRFPGGMQDFSLKIFRWAQNVHAYVMLQANPYPPFGFDQQGYPLRLSVRAAEEHNRLTVFFRIFLAIPHAIVLGFLGIGQSIVTLIAWFAILFTGQYPEGLFNFSVGVSRWTARVTAYVYLFVDDYPPFSLASSPGDAVAARPA